MASPESTEQHFPLRYGLAVVLFVGACAYGLVGVSTGRNPYDHHPEYVPIITTGVELAGRVLGAVLAGAAGFGLVAQVRRPSRAAEVLARLAAAALGVLMFYPGWPTAVVLGRLSGLPVHVIDGPVKVRTKWVTLPESGQAQGMLPDCVSTPDYTRAEGRAGADGVVKK
jgi:hypothetical protein